MMLKNATKLACAFLTLACTTALVGCRKAPVPSVKEGRFDFSVTFEVDGVVETISSVYVCEYEESGMGLSGWYINWNSYVEDSAIEALYPDEYHYECIL